jgi:uncharacterized tellurite resistance protein B-like protein
MLNQIKLFFEQHLALSAPEDSSEEKLQLATVVLFLEMMYMDDKVEPKEQEIILSLIHQHFSLTAEQTTALALAEQQRKQATDYFQFTSLINKEYSLEQKVGLIESLWKIAFIDGVLDMNEEYLVRKIADLLYVPHTAFILAKNRVEPER